jgi:hypothetical protein
MGRKKAGSKIKGGGNFNIEGPLLVNNLYDANNTGKIGKLKSIYDENLKATKEELITLTQNVKNMRDAANDDAMKRIEITKVNNIKKIADDKQSLEIFRDVVKNSSGFFKNIAILFSSLFTNIKSFFHSILYFAGFSGEGILFKIIIFGCLIAIALFIILGFSGLLPSVNFTNVNDISKKILMNDNEYNLMNIESSSLLSKMSKSMYGLVPDEYKYKFNSLNNSLSYISTGKNQFDEFLEPRNEIIIGRNDNIFHIITSEHKNNTRCLLKPTDINIEFPKDYYNNIDYNNINSNLEADINYPTTLNIPFKIEQKNYSGKYVLDTSNQIYSNLANNVTAKIDKDKYLLIQKNNKILLNSFNNINYNYNNNGVIAIYGAILINKNYKGPIMTIKTNNKYYNIFFDIINNNYYYMINNNKNIISVGGEIYTLYDQTGNGYNFYYDTTFGDARFPPELYMNGNNSYITFRRQILQLQKSYPKKKANIKSTIEILKAYVKNYNIPLGIAKNTINLLSYINTHTIIQQTFTNVIDSSGNTENEVKDVEVNIVVPDIIIPSIKLNHNNGTFKIDDNKSTELNIKDNYINLSLPIAQGNHNFTLNTTNINSFTGYFNDLLFYNSDNEVIEYYGLKPEDVYNNYFSSFDQSKINIIDFIKMPLYNKNTKMYETDEKHYINKDKQTNFKTVIDDIPSKLLEIYNDNIIDIYVRLGLNNSKKIYLRYYYINNNKYERIDNFNIFKNENNKIIIKKFYNITNDNYLEQHPDYSGAELIIEPDEEPKIKFLNNSVYKFKTPSNIAKINLNVKLISECRDYKTNTEDQYKCAYNRYIPAIDTYMDFISTKSRSLITLKYEDDEKSLYKILNEYKKELNNGLIINTDKQEIINAEIDDASKIECLGHVDDSRNDYEKKIGIGAKDGKNLIENKEKHAFIGNLYNLIITENY